MLLIIAGGVYGDSQNFSQPVTLSEKSVSIEGKQGKCGDGICDVKEKANPNLCPQDCKDVFQNQDGQIETCGQNENGYCINFRKKCEKGYESIGPDKCRHGRSSDCCVPIKNVETENISRAEKETEKTTENFDAKNSISDDCEGSDEVLISCPGVNGSYSCDYADNGQYNISGLRHSDVREMKRLDFSSKTVPDLKYKEFITGDQGEKLTSCNNIKCIKRELDLAMKEKDIPRTWMISQENMLPYYEDKSIYDSLSTYPDKFIQETNNKKGIVTVLTDNIVSPEILDEDYEKYWSSLSKKYDKNGNLKQGKIHFFRDYVSDSINLINYVEGNVSNKKDVLKFLSNVANNLITMQSRTGVFGAPDITNLDMDTLIHEDSFTSTPLIDIVLPIQQKMRDGDYGETVKCFESVNDQSWQILDVTGGLQMDNGLMIAFLSRLYEETSDNVNDWNYNPNRNRYLESAKKAGDWAVNSACVTNFNYNSASAHGLVYLYKITGEKKYLNSAIEKMKLGVFPGIIPDNHFNDWHDGRFIDPHNGKNVYHWIMVRAGIDLLKVMPQNHPDYELVKYYTNLMFDAGINEIYDIGIYKTSPAHEISKYCMFFGCDNRVKKALENEINLVIRKKSFGDIGEYYNYKKGIYFNLTLFFNTIQPSVVQYS